MSFPARSPLGHVWKRLIGAASFEVKTKQTFNSLRSMRGQSPWQSFEAEMFKCTRGLSSSTIIQLGLHKKAIFYTNKYCSNRSRQMTIAKFLFTSLFNLMCPPRILLWNVDVYARNITSCHKLFWTFPCKNLKLKLIILIIWSTIFLENMFYYFVNEWMFVCL
jgi:hypothetical protein